MIIYFVSRTIYKRRKVGSYLEHTFHFFHPNLEATKHYAKVLASRYKRRYVVSQNTYENEELISTKAIVAYQSFGKGLEPIAINPRA